MRTLPTLLTVAVRRILMGNVGCSRGWSAGVDGDVARNRSIGIWRLMP